MITFATNLHGGTAVNKQSGQEFSFLERSASVITKIDNNGFNILFNQIANEFLDVSCRALEISIAFLQRLEVNIKGGDVDDADFSGMTKLFNLDDIGLS